MHWYLTRPCSHFGRTRFGRAASIGVGARAPAARYSGAGGRPSTALWKHAVAWAGGARAGLFTQIGGARKGAAGGGGVRGEGRDEIACGRTAGGARRGELSCSVANKLGSLRQWC